MLLQQDETQLRFIVEDTGVGIPREKQKELFERFNQSAFSRNSIGIGLHLTNELVEAWMMSHISDPQVTADNFESIPQRFGKISGRVLVLFNDQRGHVVGGEKVAGNGLEFFCCDGIDALVEGLEVPLMSMM